MDKAKTDKKTKTETEKKTIIFSLDTLKPAYGSTHRRKIIGRGEGSGHGGSSTRGRKGQKSRSGSGKMTGFEGGQIPLLRRIPKRGFTNRYRKEFQIVNIGRLDELFNAGEEVTLEKMQDKGLVRYANLVKVLGNGDLKKSFTIKANAFSKSAEEKIKASGGKAEIVKVASVRQAPSNS